MDAIAIAIFCSATLRKLRWPPLPWSPPSYPIHHKQPPGVAHGLWGRELRFSAMDSAGEDPRVATYVKDALTVMLESRPQRPMQFLAD
jgi:hypothetical protein